MAANGHNQPIIASTQRLLERLPLSENCRIVSFRTLAKADEGNLICSVRNTIRTGHCNFTLALIIILAMVSKKLFQLSRHSKFSCS